MKLVELIEFLRRHMKTVVRLSVGVLIVLVIADLVFVNKAHAHTGAEKIPGFWAGFGLVACAVIILASKWFGHTGIMTREDYYDE
jgi:hypothetical protein